MLDRTEPNTKFDLMADLCILAGQAVMKVGSDEMQSAMRVVLATLGREVALRAYEADDEPVRTRARRSAGAARGRTMASCG